MLRLLYGDVAKGKEVKTEAEEFGERWNGVEFKSILGGH